MRTILLLLIALGLTFDCYSQQSENKKTTYVVPPLAKDKVQSFGYKCSWIAVHTTNMSTVINALSLRDPHPCSWADGIGKGYDNRVFVTPPLRGYVLCAASFLPEFPTAGQQRDEITPILEGLAKHFDDVQYFFTYRVVEAHAWARFTNGKPVRVFAVSDFKKLRDIGPKTEAESKVEFPFTTEDDVMRVAGQWSIDPSKLEKLNLEVTQGIIGSL